MSRGAHLVVFLLLGSAVIGEETSKDQDSVPNDKDQRPDANEVGAMPQNLKYFFDLPIKPLSFSDLDKPSKSASQSYQADPENIAEASSVDKNWQGKAAEGTAMVGVLQGIRDLKLTLTEIDEKLETVVQKITPTKKEPLMKKGVDWLQRLVKFGDHGGKRRQSTLTARGGNSGIGLRF